MFGNDYVFTDYPTTEEEMVEMLKGYTFNEDQIEQSIEAVLNTAGGYCITLSREKAESLVRVDAPHFMKRLIPPVGLSVVVVNLADLTPDEELAISAHEFGHVYCGHEPSLESILQCEMEADWFAVVGVGAVHLYNALTKIASKFYMKDDEFLIKRLDAIRPYV